MGVGLFRTEYLFMTGDALPDEERHYQTARRGARAARRAGRRRSARSISAPTSSRAFLEDAELDEANPALGLRSIRLCLSELGRELFRAQLRGLLRASAHGPLKIMFPMISGVAELRAVEGGRRRGQGRAARARASRSTRTSSSAS